MSRKYFEGLAVDNMKKTRFNGYFFYFSVDYDAVVFDDILDIHKYLMKKKIYRMIRIIMFGFIKKIFLTELTVV